MFDERKLKEQIVNANNIHMINNRSPQSLAIHLLLFFFYVTTSHSQTSPPPLAPNGKPAKDPIQPLSPSNTIPEIIEEPPEETVPERRDAPPLPMPPLVHTENKFTQPPKRIFVQDTRTMPPLPSLPLTTIVPPYADREKNENNLEYRHQHNTKGTFHLQDPIVEEENEEKEEENEEKDENGEGNEKKGEGDADEKDADLIATDDKHQHRQRKIEKERYENEKELLEAAAVLEAKQDELLIRNGGDEDAAKEEEEVDIEKSSENEDGGEESDDETDDANEKVEEASESVASVNHRKMKDGLKLNENANIKIASEHAATRFLRR